MSRWFPAVVLLCQACLPTVDFSAPPVCDAADGGVSTPTGRAVLVGEATQVTLSRRSPVCPPSLDVTVQAEVSDPSGQTAAFLQEGPFARGAFVSVDLRFTPMRPGRHQVVATFDPALGRALNEVVAVERMTPARRLGSIDARVPCLQEDVTGLGAWICLDASRVSFWRRARQLQSVPGVGFQVVADVVWVFGRGEVERFVDRGGDVLVREPDAVLPLGSDLAVVDQTVAVDEGRLVLLKAGVLHAFELTSGLLTRSPAVGLPRGLCPGEVQLAARGREEVRLACPSRPGWVRSCVLPLAVPASVRCDEDEGRLLGVWPAATWLATDAGLKRRGDQGVTMEAFPTGWSLATSTRLGGLPSPVIADTQAVAFVPAVGALTLEAAPAGLEVLSAGPSRVLLKGLDSRLILAR